MVGAGDDDLFLERGAGILEVTLGMVERQVFVLLGMNNQSGTAEAADTFERPDLFEVFEKARGNFVGAVFAGAVGQEAGFLLGEPVEF